MFKEKRQTYIMSQELRHKDLSKLKLDQNYEGIK